MISTGKSLYWHCLHNEMHCWRRLNQYFTSRITTVCSSKRILRYASSSITKSASEEEMIESSVSKSVKATLKKSLEYENLMKERKSQYEIGKRHLANMMGQNIETFTQEDVDRAISYLMPSGLYEKKARPLMKPPEEVFPLQKAPPFDRTGRPFHHLFYTRKPSFYSVLQELALKAQHLEHLVNTRSNEPEGDRTIFDSSKWKKKEEFEEIIHENITNDLFERFILSMERLMSNPLAHKEKDFIMKFRDEIKIKLKTESIPEIEYTETGIPYVTASGMRKTATATATVYGQGTGKIRVNGDDILYFEDRQDRRQLMCPLQMSGLIRSVDVEATVEGGGVCAQAGAIRYCISMALRPFVPEIVVEKMRLAGLLTQDTRTRERKKVGKRGARAGRTWKKR